MSATLRRSIKAAGDFSLVADAYREYRPGYPQDLFARIIEDMPSSSTIRMVDLGCGTGNVSRALASSCPIIFGIDPSLNMLRQATKHELDRTGSVLWIQGFAEGIPLQSRTIDLITIGQAFHWFNQEIFATEAKRILKPGGLVAIFGEGAQKGEPYRTLFHALMDEFLNQPGKTGPICCSFPDLTKENNPLFQLGFAGVESETFSYEIGWDLSTFTGFMRSTSRAAQFTDSQWEILCSRFKSEVPGLDQDGSFVEKNVALLYTGILTVA